MRTVEEILKKIDEVFGSDMFGATRSDLIHALPYADAKPFLNDDVSEEGWVVSTATQPEDRIAGYLPFAIGKAKDHRGLSANRSINHMFAWVWLMGDDAFAKIDWDRYPQYGVPILKQVAELVGFEWPADDEALNNMAAGAPCRPDCQDGCV